MEGGGGGLAKGARNVVIQATESDWDDIVGVRAMAMGTAHCRPTVDKWANVYQIHGTTNPFCLCTIHQLYYLICPIYPHQDLYWVITTDHL